MKNTNYLFLRALLILSFPFSLYGQNLSIESSNRIKENVENISVDPSYANGNWKSVLDKVKDKRTVLLGELNHGIKEIYLVRNDLIKILHKEAGFNVILFEAGIGEVFTVDYYKSKISPEVMIYSLMSQWQTKEFSDLFAYMKSNNISIGGFDIQRGFGGFFDKILEEQCQINNVDSLLYKDLEDKFVQQKKVLANRNTAYNEVSTKTFKLIDSYKTIYDRLDTQSSSSLKRSFALKTIENRIDFLTYMLEFVKDKDWNKRWAARDFGMANNVKWLLNNTYKDEKVIIVAHNYHIAKYNAQEEVMGEYLKQVFKDEIYSIGTFVGSGVYRESGEVKEIAPIDNNGLDVKNIINVLDDRVHFMDIPIKESNRDVWMDKKIVVNDSFLNLSRGNEMILSQWFDGIILIDKSTIPEKHN